MVSTPEVPVSESLPVVPVMTAMISPAESQRILYLYLAKRKGNLSPVKLIRNEVIYPATSASTLAPSVMTVAQQWRDHVLDYLPGAGSNLGSNRHTRRECD